MEPRIQYAKTEDGVNIAYWTMGEGEPFVMVPTLPFSHVQLEWKVPAYARWYEHFAKDRLLLHYDSRGVGLSQKNVTDYSLEAQLRDLAAVVDRAELPQFALWAYGSYGGAIGVAYAAQFPERVTRLVLFSPALSGILTPALDVMREENWELYLKTVSYMVMGWPEGEIAAEIRGMMAESIAPRTAAAVGDALKDFDIARRLSQVATPTLVITRRQGPTSLDAVAAVAAQLSNARLVVLEGDSLAFIGDPEIVTVIDEFLGEEPTRQSRHAPAGTAVIVFLDIAGSTALTERLGDGVMAIFASARQAIEAALRCRAAGAEAELPLHVGIHAGVVSREGSNVHGGAVQLAARVADASAPGEILVSDTLRGLARTSAGVAFEDRGEHELKGIAEPVRLYAVREQE